MAGALNIDIFAESKSFAIQGRSHYPSVLGALLTVTIFLVVLVYGTNKIIVMHERDDNTFQEVTKRLSLDRDKTFKQEDMDMSFALYMVDYRTGKLMSKEDTKGYYEDWSALLLGFDAFSFEVTNYVPLPLTTCSADYIDKLLDVWDIDDDAFKEQANANMLCIEEPSLIELKSYQISGKFQRMQISL